MIVDAFMMNAPHFESCHAVESQPHRSIRWRQSLALYGALEHSELVAQRENLQLERGRAPKRSGD
jgi:hypothetical protein